MPIPGTFNDPKKKRTDDPGNIAPSAISAVAVSGIAGGSATITWTTSLAASSQVQYGIVPNLSQVTAETDTSPLVTSHSVALTGLVAGKIYTFLVKSRLGGGKDGMNRSVMNGYVATASGVFVAA